MCWTYKEHARMPKESHEVKKFTIFVNTVGGKVASTRTSRHMPSDKYIWKRNRVRANKNFSWLECWGCGFRRASDVGRDFTIKFFQAISLSEEMKEHTLIFFFHSTIFYSAIMDWVIKALAEGG